MNPADFHNIAEAFEAQAKKNPKKTGLIYLGTHYSYERIRAWAQSFAQSLEGMGIEPGDRVVLYLPNCPQWVVC